MPEDFIELLSLVCKNGNGHEYNVSVWRGQANIDWKLDSSIVRKSLHQNPSEVNAEKIDWMITFGEERMLNKARKNLYDYDIHNRRLSDIELLAKLQHFGAATRLLDFSKSVLNALWFCASDRKYSENIGILLGVDTNIISGIGEDYFDFSQSYSSFCAQIEENDLSGKPRIWMIDAPVVTQRISAQNSVFLCGKCKNSPHGYFPLPKDAKHLKSIAISSGLKAESLTILSSHFNITPYTIFPDIEGFSSANSSQWNFFEFDRW